MKKTVTLTNLIKAKNDLELFIKIDQMKRLKKLFDPSFSIEELGTKIAAKEDQLITIKLAIDEGNSAKDSDGKTLHYYIYQLSKLNRQKADLLAIQRRLETNDMVSNNDQLKKSLLGDISDLNTLMSKEEDKKKKSEYLSSKNKLKRSLSKLTTITNSSTIPLLKYVQDNLVKVEESIVTLKNKLTELNSNIKVEVDLSEEFDIIVK